MGFAKHAILTLLISLGGTFHLGYHLTIFNPSQVILRQFVNDSHFDRYDEYLTKSSYSTIWSLIVNSYILGALVGVLLVPFIADRFGRRFCIIVNNVMCLIGVVLLAIAKYLNLYEIIGLGRLIVGYGVGGAISIQPVFISESFPQKYRGILNTMAAFLPALGCFIAATVAQPWFFGTSTLWPAAFFILIISLIIAMGTIYYCHESPKYLIHTCASADKIAAAISFYYEETDQLQSIKNKLICELESTKSSEKAWREVLFVYTTRKATILGSVINMNTGICGIMIYNLYSTYILEDVGFSDKYAAYITIAISVMLMISTLPAIYLVERLGRWPLLVWGHVILQLLNIMVMIGGILYLHYGYSWVKYFVMTTIITWVFVFGAGPVTVTYFITAEMVPQNARSTAQTIAIAAGWISRIPATFLFLPLEHRIGHFTFLFYIVPVLLLSAYVAMYLPETKQKHLETVINQLKKEPSKRLKWRTGGAVAPTDHDAEYEMEERNASGSSQNTNNGPRQSGYTNGTNGACSNDFSRNRRGRSDCRNPYNV